jgi:RND family efflux transporter MFP subunit
MVMKFRLQHSVLIFTLGISLLIAGCSSEGNAPQNEEELVKSVNVHTQKVEPKDFTSYARMIGTIESAQDVRLSAEVSGRVLQYRVNEGEIVQKGEVIAKINDQQLEKEEARLEAVTQQSYEQFKRQERLWKKDSIGSEIDYLNAKYQYEQNKAALEQVRVNIENTEVKAPFRAVMNEKLVEEGEMVATGTPMARLIAQDKLKISAGVPARYAELVMPGDSVRVWFDTIDSDTLAGPINYVSNSIDPQARTFTIEMVIPNKDRRYKVGMIANVRLKLRQMKKEMVIGSEYVYRKEGNYVVYTAEKNGEGNSVAREKIVELGPTYNNQVVINKGLRPGEDLITVGSSFLENEMRIEVVEEETTNFADNNR